MLTPEIRSVHALRAEGWTPKDVRDAVAGGTLERVRRARYAVAGEREPKEAHLLRALAAWQARSPDHVVSHTSAAVLHGLPVRAAVLDEVHLSRWSSTHGKVTSGVRLHRVEVPDADVVTLHGVRVTCLERTIADLARREAYEWGVIAADAALRLGADADRLAELVAAGGRKRGNGRFREVVAFADGRSESPGESMSRVSMARAGIPAPVLQYEVHLPGRGGWVATTDFGWPEFGVVGEMDGKVKYTADPARGRTAADVVMEEKDRDALIIACDHTPAHWGWKLGSNHFALGQHLRSVFRSRGFVV